MNSHETQLDKELFHSWEELCKTKGNSKSLRHLVLKHANEISNIWESYTSDRRNIGKLRFTSARNTLAYLLAFHVPNLFRAQMLWERAWPRLQDNIKDSLFKQKIHILDIGSGTGAGTLATLSHLQRQHIPTDNVRVTFIESNRAFLGAACQQVSQLFPAVEVKQRRTTLGDLHTSSVLNSLEDDTIYVLIFSYLLNEIISNPRELTTTEKLLEGFSKKNTIIVYLDPAAELSAKTAMNIRDQWTHAGFSVIYPCPHSNSCPMLPTGDWCYSELKPEWPKGYQKAYEGISRLPQHLGVSGYIFTTQKSTTNSLASLVGTPRVKGSKQIQQLFCTSLGLTRITQLQPVTLQGQSTQLK